MRAAFTFPLFGRYASLRMFTVSLCLAIMSVGVSAWLCSGSASGCDRSVDFVFTPSVGPAVTIDRVCANGPELSEAPQGCDRLVVFDLPGSNRFFQYQEGPAQACPKIFTALLENASVVYDMQGTWLRDFGATGASGPFATGSFSTGQIDGTFTFTE